MKQTNRLIAAAVCITSLVATGAVLSDDDHGTKMFRSWFGGARRDVDPVESELYVTECGGCHFPYQPGLLPAYSWEEIMNGLDQHFGENAELDGNDQKAIQNFLLSNAAGEVKRGLPNKLMAAQRGKQAPLRITQMRYFVHEHSELPKKLVEDNPKVRSFSNCDSCHQKAKQGLYDEHDVRIPGFGRWDD
jgi:Dihaem cytochrome c